MASYLLPVKMIRHSAGRDGQAAVHTLDGHSALELREEARRETRKPTVNERLEDVLNAPREKLEIEDGRKKERGDNQNGNTRDSDRGEGHGL